MNQSNENKSDKNYFDVNEEELEKIDFSVEFRDVYVDFGNARLSEKTGDGKWKQEKHRAVVDVERSYTFAIVSPDYEVVTNAQAVKLAEKCFQSVFQLTDTSQMQLFNVIMPQTRSQCHIDFLHRRSRISIDDRDPWAPFIRVSNSFNRSRALKFDLGFCRGICRNGIIFGKDSIEFKFSHSKGVADLALAEFRLKGGEFSQLEAQFIGRLKNLKRFHVPRKYMWPLLCKVFGLTPPHEDASARTKDNWLKQQEAVGGLTQKYFTQLEDTGYAALNVLTDFASRPPSVGFGGTRIHGLQTASGIWVEEFVEAMSSESFDFKEYLGDYYALAV